MSEFAVCLARTDPSVPKRQGITYFIVDLRSPGVEIRPLRHLGGLVEFNEVWLEEVRVPDSYRVGAIGDGWRVAATTLAGERQMSAGSGSGGMERIGGVSANHLLEQIRGTDHSPIVRQRLMHVYIEERIRRWTNDRVRARVKAGGTPGPAASIGKVHQGQLNQTIQMAATDLLGADAMAWPTEPGVDWASSMPLTVKGMFRSRANTIEGGTTEVNKNVLGEQILGLPREPDKYHGQPWQDIPRNG
jgi:alkylation response protein AidB-like acyl-CoA dehydrogenase